MTGVTRVLNYSLKNPLKVYEHVTLRGLLPLGMVVFLFFLNQIIAFVGASNHQ